MIPVPRKQPVPPKPFPVHPNRRTLVKQHLNRILGDLPISPLLSLCKQHQIEVPAHATKHLLTEHLATYFQRHAVSELVDVVTQYLDASVADLKTLFERLTATQRASLVAGGYLTISRTAEVTAYGKVLMVPYYDYFDYLNLLAHQAQIPDAIAYGRYFRLKSATHQEKQRLATERERQRRQLHREQQAEFRAAYKLAQAHLGEPGTLAYLLLNLAFWTHHINHLAKLDQQVDYYRYKDLALRLLFRYRDTEFVSVGVYTPDQPDKRKLTLCSHHFDEYREYYRDWGDSVMTYYATNQAVVNQCPGCELQVVPDYYTLYFFEINNEKLRYGFHVPYRKALTAFGDRTNYPSVDHSDENQEGPYRFGRAITKDELAVLGNPTEIVNQFEQAYNDLLQFEPPNH